MIFLDTSALIGSLAGERPLLPVFRRAVNRGERLAISSIVLYEWLRGPRSTEELDMQEMLLPRDSAFPFGSPEAALAARLYREVPRPRGREIVLAIAACAIIHQSGLWTTNAADFKDIPGLSLLMLQA